MPPISASIALSTHTSLNGKTPMDVLCSRLGHTPLHEDIADSFNVETELFRTRDYKVDCRLQAALKAKREAADKQASSESM